MLKKWFGEKNGTIAGYVIAVVLITTVFLALWLSIGTVIGVIRNVFDILAPVLYAIVAVLIINPAVHLFEDKVFAFLVKPGKKQRPALRRTLSICCSYLLFVILLLAVIVIVFVPLVQSVEDLATVIPGAIRSTVSWIESTVSKTPILAGQKDLIMNSINNSTLFSPEAIQQILSTILSSASSVFSEAATIVLGLIISIYIIASLDYLRHIRDWILAAFFSKEREGHIRSDCRAVSHVFSDFITGRLLYSIILGIVLFIFLGLLEIPFYSVISIGMGLLAYIPVIGTVLSFFLGCLLCLIFSPSKCLWCALGFFCAFLLGKLFLQPYIIRKNATCSVGLAIISVVVMYPLFGVVGVIFAVPTFLVLTRAARRWINRRLDKKKPPKDDPSAPSSDAPEDNSPDGSLDASAKNPAANTDQETPNPA